jgi:pyruvate-formate lyase-activating enzyme
MIIRHKGIYHERTEDAPFIGALICAIDCNINCDGCFNQSIKDEPILTNDSQEIVNKVLLNPFNEGIILAGLEWTLQPEEMKELIRLAIFKKLKVMLYTGLDEKSFKTKFTSIYNLPDIYIKFGSYREDLKSNDNIQYRVKLASTNQKIKWR